MSRDSLLIAWIKSYKENKYNVIEKKRGRKSNGKEEYSRRATSGEQSLEREDAQTRSRELILKKLYALIQEREQREKKKSPKR